MVYHIVVHVYSISGTCALDDWMTLADVSGSSDMELAHWLVGRTQDSIRGGLVKCEAHE